MKHLYLIRHAEAEPLEYAPADFKRNLTAHGEQEAVWVGQQLKIKAISIDVILSSSAQRAQQTAQLLSRELDLPSSTVQVKEELYQANSQQLQSILEALPETIQTIMLVAHNPGISLFAQALVGDGLSNFPTCGVCHIELDLDNWRGLHATITGRLCEFISPPRVCRQLEDRSQ